MTAPTDTLFPAPTEEDRRLSALHALGLLDSEPEGAFDALVALTATRFDCPVSMLTLIDRNRQWIKAKFGTDLEETSRDVAFCDHTIRGDAPLVVTDAALDPRFADNPLVVGDPQIRFYAGAPIHVADGGERHAIGAICLIDDKPREMTAEQAETLTHIATVIEALIAARRAALEAVSIAESAQAQSRVLRRQERVFRQVERMSMIGSWRLDLGDESVTWSDGVYRIHELEPGTSPDLLSALDFYPPHDRATISDALTGTIESGAPYEVEVDFITAKGKRRRVRSRGELEVENGRAVAVIGVFQDVTDRYRVERKLRESASTDEVTRIANRAEFNRVLEAELQAARRGKPVVLVLIDLDHFKTTNDTYGHMAGDDVLRAIGQRLRAPFLNGSFAARLGGDEFALLLTDPELVADAPATIARLLELLRTPVQSKDDLLAVSGTIGSARPGPGVDTVGELMHAADIALYTAKRARRGTAHAFVAPGVAAVNR
ncbi:hypothetical protein ASG11_08340 [Sphingomonas sp. Leaf357]|nr:hypothetical protein ASG11_08340 [Sphingomonas sp. Leaf357]